ncbi:MAG: hypothetical protein GY934_25225 [Gammaproteobacteria bacterium]|nr:hypothetical protein [Gammaproteobacteria bacterium]
MFCKREKLQLASLLVAGCLVTAASGNLYAAQGPTLKLFPTNVLEEIKHTGSVAKEMESGLHSVITRLDQQQQLYRDSKCEGGEGDPGCEQISKQMGDTYLEMLNIMGDKLPEMEVAVNATSASLEKRLRKELGQKRSAWELQELLLGKGGQAAGKQQPAMRGRSGMRLSDRFSQYYKLVARPGSRADASLTVVASDIYLDMQETGELIARTREEINRATLMGQLNQSFGAITPEMQDVVAGVKSILFGEEEVMAPSSSGVVALPEQEYVSPLQL